MKIDLQKLNPFNKSKDQKRDNDGKFTAGSGGLSKLKKFNWGRNAPIIAVVTLVGGYFVYQSFAGVALYRYQYSAYQCPSFNKDDTAKNKDASCVNGSAEALVYRYYKAVFGRDPDTGGYKYWTQQLAGDRTKPSRVAQLLQASGEAQYDKMPNADYVAKLYQNVLSRNGDPGGMAFWTKRLDNGSWTKDKALANFAATAKITVAEAQTKMGKPTNEQFVKGLYVSLMGREADAGGLSYWKGQLDTNKITRSDLLARFAVDQASMTALGTSFANFVKTAPKNEVVQTALRIRDERLYTAAANANNSKKAVDPVNERVSKARQERDGAKSTANKSVPSRGDLTAIANREKTVRDYLSESQNVPSTTGSLLSKNEDLYKKAVDVAKWSPDISADQIKGEYDKTVLFHEYAKNGREDLKKLIGEISSSYKAAETKYEAEQERLAADTTDTTDTTDTDTGCGDYKTKSGSNCVDKYIGATAVGCAPGYRTHKAPFGNKNKYSCINGSNLALPRTLQCAKSGYYKVTQIGTYYKACVRGHL